MNTEQLWEIFASTGKIDDYLHYISHKDLNNDNA